MANIALSQLHLYHEIDRKIFRRILVNMRRNSFESLLVMAFWIWLESIGYPSITLAIKDESNTIVDVVVDEAILCLNCLESKIPATSGGRLPLTSRILMADISLESLSLCKYSAIYNVKSILHNVCPWVFSDIIIQNSGRSNNNEVARLEGPVILCSPQHTTFESVELLIRPLNCRIPLSGLWGWKLPNKVPRDERTIFLTFSRGFPVNEVEVLELFNSNFGNCVEYLKMGQVIQKQSLYARIVVSTLYDVDQILVGHHVAKFRIHGKHIWARKYERR